MCSRCLLPVTPEAAGSSASTPPTPSLRSVVRGTDVLRRAAESCGLGQRARVPLPSPSATGRSVVRSIGVFRVERQLLNLEVFDTCGVDLAREAARNRMLRGRGHTVRKPMDCLIATFCMCERHSLLHRDDAY
jgi:hypothetical protein